MQDSQPDTSTQSVQKKGNCRFFASDSGCRNGDACPFKHAVKSDEKDDAIKKKLQRGQKKGKKNVGDGKENHSDFSKVDNSIATANTSTETSPAVRAQAVKEVVRNRVSTPATVSSMDAARKPVARPAPRVVENLTPLQMELKAIERRFRASYKVVSATPLLINFDSTTPASASTSPSLIPSAPAQLPPTIVEFGVHPSDPDFPFDLDSLLLTLVIPSRVFNSTPGTSIHPHISSTLADTRIKVLNPEIPPELSRAVEIGWRRQLEVALSTPTTCIPGQTLLSLLNWLDRNLERLLSGLGSENRDVVGVVGIVVNQNRHTQEELRRGIAERVDAGFRGMDVLIPRATAGLHDGGYKDRVFYYGVPVTDGNDSSGSDSDGEGTGSEFNEVDTESTASHVVPEDLPDESSQLENDPIENISTTSTTTIQHRGTQIKLLNPSMKGIALLECVNPKFLLSCSRCKSNFDSPPQMPPNSLQIRACPTCSTTLSITYRPSMVHMSSQTAGYLDLDGYSVVDMLPSAWQVTCEGCNKITGNVGILKSLPRGEVEMRVGCTGCHAKMGIMISEIKFIKLMPSIPQHATTLALKPKKKKQLDEGFVLGEPLPQNGACKHYRKSYRWFRFPCCGRAFACDMCHEESKSDGHEMTWANRMICGFCCSEQVYSQQASCLCGKELTRRSGGKGGFWEGGQGTRSRVLMSKKDTRKTKGLGKTVSMKASRVGKKTE
ncbi:hypothetical protein BJ741DRAFT_627097 [Chytriomyces cf. hyalinus JEL632]|nr:hypothetical protein BJ741DRAFT_627097 [Chytriomyces cf. hyalinus JEL632]